MSKHPLHPKLIDALSEYKTCPEAMRDAYDMGREKGHHEMLNEVMKWLDKNLTNYTDNDYLGDCLPFYMLESDLKKAMRPQQQEDN